MQAIMKPEIQERFVPYIDDNPNPSEYVGSGNWSISMPTAIAYIFSDEGFVIAADGLNIVRRKDGPDVMSRCTQKIFELSGIDRHVAVSFIGMVTLFNEAGEMAFNFISACIEAAKTIEHVPVRDPNELAAQICPLVQQRLVAIRDGGELDRYPSPELPRLGERGHTIVRIFLDGYFNGQPFRTGMRFYHDEQELLWAPFSHDVSPQRKNVLFGADLIGRFLFDTEDPRLEKHRTDACRLVAARFKQSDIFVPLKDAIEAARNFIAACSDPVAKEIERWDYQRIGGEPHVVTITPQRGFDWALRPKHFDPL
jgi:hypothetical protein